MADNAPPVIVFAEAIRRRPLTVLYATRMTAHLAYTIRCEFDYPSNPELHERLETIKALSQRARATAARDRVLRELADPRILALLSNGDDRVQRILNPLIHPLNLPSVGRLAAAALARVPRKQGRRKFYPDPSSGPDAPEYCALIVSMAWKKDTGKRPGQSNPTAQSICELMWRRAGGVQHAHQDCQTRRGTFATWRKHLVAARRYYPAHPAGKLVERILGGDPPKRRPQHTEAQSSRWRELYDHPSRTAFFSRKTSLRTKA